MSERAIQRTLESVSRGRTALVVAHRLSTVRSAGRIVVMDGGKVVDQGTHDELLLRGGLYTNRRPGVGMKTELERTHRADPWAGPADPLLPGPGILVSRELIY